MDQIDGSEMVQICASTSLPLIESVVDLPVVVRNASKCYFQRNTKDHVLVDMNMTIKKGSVYGLLGPSGCGKTTLLRCIIGRLKLDEGFILTLGKTPGTPNSGIPGPRLGYMPQEDALDEMMTIKEILYYYGCLLGVSKKIIRERVAFLVKFLKLPSKRMLFSSLSGGQKRRVSFAVSLINDAELLILDEPTVGVDPILKQNIWNYLYELVQDGKKTVIITTHYIEEARNANFVGFMFQGCLLAEDSPEQLLAQYHRKTLEDVFYCVCMSQMAKEETCETKVLTANDKEVEATAIPLCGVDGQNKAAPPAHTSSEFHSLQLKKREQFAVEKASIRDIIVDYCPDVRWMRLQAILYRGFVQLFRYPGLLLLILISPSFQVSLCGFALGRHVTDIRVAILNEDSGRLANQFLSLVDKHVIQQTTFTSWDDAYQSVKEGHTWGIIRFHHNFSDSLLYRFNNTPYVDVHILQYSSIDVSLDGTNFLFAETVRFVLLDAYEKFISKVLDENNVNPSFAKIPLVNEEPVFGNRSDPYSVFIMPSFITASSFFAQMGLSIIALFLDKEGGKLERLYVTGITPFEVVFGFLVLQTVVLMSGVCLTLIVALVIFEFDNRGSLLLVILLATLQGMCGTLFGVFVSSCVKRFPTTSILAMTSLVLSTAVGGFFWPLEACTSIVKFICMSTPFPLAANAMRHIMFRSWNLLHPGVMMGFGISMVWILVLLAGSVIVLRIKKTA